MHRKKIELKKQNMQVIWFSPLGIEGNRRIR